MERLLSVEVLTNSCCCCLQSLPKSQRNSKNEISEDFQQIFEQLFGEELLFGSICNGCASDLHQIVDFKKRIQNLRLGSDLQTFIKLENEVEDLVAPTEVILDDPVVSFAAHPGKRTKIESLMQKYGAKFVNNEIGRGIKTPKVICPLCDKILTVTAFRVHMQRHEGTQELPFMCEICSKKFPSNAEFVVHKRSHTKEKPFQCDRCPSKFFNCKKNLIVHLRTLHLDIRKPRILKECETCGKKVIELNYQRHLIKNHPNGENEGPRIDPETELFHCQACDGQFRTKHAHDNHFCAKNTNDGPSQQVCLICNTRSRTRLEATKHIQEVHAERIDETRWQCLVCNTIVSSKIILHIESVHTPLGSSCEFCNKQLKNRRCLKNHIYVCHNNGSEVRKMRRKLSKTNKS